MSTGLNKVTTLMNHRLTELYIKQYPEILFDTVLPVCTDRGYAPTLTRYGVNATGDSTILAPNGDLNLINL